MEFVAPQFNPPADILGAYLRGQMAPGIVQEQQQQLQQGADTNQYNQLKFQQMRMALQLGQRAMQSQQPQPEAVQPGMEGLQEQHPRAGAQEGYLPSDYNIPSAPVPQIDPALGTALSNLAGGESVYKTLLDSQKQKEEQQQAMVKTAQLKAQGPLMTFDAIAASPNPARMVMNNPSIMAQWPKAAMQLGLDPVKDFNDENVRQAAIFGSNQIRAAVQMPQASYPNAAPMTTFQKRSTDLEQERIDLERQRLVKESGAPASGFDDPKVQDLQAAISSTGYSLPAGFRSKEQQLSLYKGLLRKYDGLSPDDVAHLLASNAVDFKAITKATQTAATIGGRVEVANNELQAFVPIAQDASALVDRGDFVPFNRLKQKGQASISDPNLKRLFVATQTILNAYDLLAARGGTDKDKRAENHRILENADSPEAYNAALGMIVKEGQAAGGAARASMKASAFGFPGGTGESGKTESAAERAKRLGL